MSNAGSKAAKVRVRRGVAGRLSAELARCAILIDENGGKGTGKIRLESGWTSGPPTNSILKMT